MDMKTLRLVEGDLLKAIEKIAQKLLTDLMPIEAVNEILVDVLNTISNRISKGVRPDVYTG
jgi:hypothetical protein